MPLNLSGDAIKNATDSQKENESDEEYSNRKRNAKILLASRMAALGLKNGDLFTLINNIESTIRNTKYNKESTPQSIYH